jgi:hypothetical protein
LTYPPIPPNCPYFHEAHGDFFFKLVDCDFTHRTGAIEPSRCFLALVAPGVYWRPIIAAVAEVAWRKEASRRMTSAAEVPEIPGESGEAYWIRHDAYVQQALNHGSAWRRWGQP